MEGEELYPNAISFMLDAGNDRDISATAPRVQCISLKLLDPANDKTVPRYRFIVSDGKYYSQAMLNTQLNHLVEDNLIQRHTTFKVPMVAVNNVQNKRLLILISIDPATIVQVDHKIGEPISIETLSNPGGAVPSPSLSAANNSPQPTTSTSSTRVAAPAQRTLSASGHERAPNVLPIEALSPYTNKWTIKARVTQKSDMKTWSNARGDGKLFSCNFLDNTGEIKATAFNAAADEWYERIKEGGVYFVSRARVNPAKKKFSTVQNEYEITLEKTSEVVECLDTTDAPQIQYNFVTLDKMESIQKDSTCDVIAVVHQIQPITEIISKTTSKPVKKRELTLVDRSENSIRMTLWGKTAENFTSEDHPVVAFKGVKVGDYQGRNLGMFSGSSMQTDPDLPEAHMLRGWYDSAGSGASFHAQSSAGAGGAGGSGVFRHAEVKTLQVVQDTLLGLEDKPDYFSARVRIVHVKPDNMSYTACPECSKKVIETEDGSWRCEKCARNWPEPMHRYLLSMSCADHTGQIWLQGFNEVGELIMGCTAKELHELNNEDTKDQFTKKMADAVGNQWNLSCRVKQEVYQDVPRARYGINKAFQMDYAEEGRLLIDQINKYPPSIPQN